MADILDQNSGGDAELDLYGETDALDPQFTEQDVLGNDDDDDDEHNVNDDDITHENGSNGDVVKLTKSDEPDDNDEDESDLYDAAIEPSADAKPNDISSGGSSSGVGGGAGTMTQSSSSFERSGRRFCCYVGNMTWWTTDADLQDAIYSSGIGDLVDIKFYENRNNGQSKGFALTVFSSENAVRQCIDKLPQKQLHGQPLVVLPYTKTSLAKFEEATRRPDQRSDKKPGDIINNSKKDGIIDKAVVNFGTIRIGPGLQQQQSTSMQQQQQTMPPISLRVAQSNVAATMQALRQPPPSLPSLVMSGQQQQQQQRAPVPLQSLAPPRPLSLIANNAPPPGIMPQQIMMNRPPPIYAMQQQQQHLGAPMPPRHVLPPMHHHTAPQGFPPPGAHINPQVCDIEYIISRLFVYRSIRALCQMQARQLVCIIIITAAMHHYPMLNLKR